MSGLSRTESDRVGEGNLVIHPLYSNSHPLESRLEHGRCLVIRSVAEESDGACISAMSSMHICMHNHPHALLFWSPSPGSPGPVCSLRRSGALFDSDSAVTGPLLVRRDGAVKEPGMDTPHEGRGCCWPVDGG